jgi:hypothetical protein
MMLVQLKMPKWLGTLVLLSNFKFKQKMFLKFWVIFLIWIRIRIQPTKIDADPCGSTTLGSLTLILTLITFAFFLVAYMMDTARVNSRTIGLLQEVRYLPTYLPTVPTYHICKGP